MLILIKSEGNPTGPSGRRKGRKGEKRKDRGEIEDRRADGTGRKRPVRVAGKKMKKGEGRRKGGKGEE
jgi:hypothetical protein